jgi:hypothetical protein
MAKQFKDKEDMVKWITGNQDLLTQHLMFRRITRHLLEMKYKDVDCSIEEEPFEQGKASEFVVVNNKDNKVIESFQGETAFRVEITGLNDKNDFVVVDELALDRIWGLYREIYSEEKVDAKSVLEGDNIFHLDVNLIDPSPFQTRENFDDVENMVESIKEHGILEPITVIKKDERYILVGGERRLRAVKQLEWTTIPSIVYNDGVDLNILGAVSNAQRSNPNVVALANYVGRTRVEIKKTNSWGGKKGIIPEDKLKGMDINSPFSSCSEIDDVIYKELGLSQRMQYNLVSILRETEEIQDKIKKGELAFAEGIVTINIDKKDLPEEFRRAIIDAERRSKIIEKLEKKAKDTNDPNAKFLRYYAPLEKMRKYVDTSVIYFDKVDEKTRQDVIERSIDFIRFLAGRLDINLKEI